MHTGTNAQSTCGETDVHGPQKDSPERRKRKDASENSSTSSILMQFRTLSWKMKRRHWTSSGLKRSEAKK